MRALAANLQLVSAVLGMLQCCVVSSDNGPKLFSAHGTFGRGKEGITHTHADRFVVQKVHAIGDGVLKFAPLEETVGAVVSGRRVRQISERLSNTTATGRAPTARGIARALTEECRSWYARLATAPRVGVLSSCSCRGTTGGPRRRGVPSSVRETHRPAASSRRKAAP